LDLCPELRLKFFAEVAAVAAAVAATAAEPQSQVFHQKCHFQNLSKKNHKVKKNWKKYVKIFLKWNLTK
jgi:hypothetical protein